VSDRVPEIPSGPQVSDHVLEIPPEIVGRAREGDEAALERLVRAAYPVVRRWALVRTGDPVEADDLTQDVLIRMIRKLDSYEGGSAFATWLYSVTRNAALDRFRGRRRRERLEEEARVRLHVVPSAAEDPARAVEGRDVERVVTVFFEELPERQREVFDLVELQGIPTARVAALLGIEPVSVRANLFKARRTIRERILESMPEVAEDFR
jgi:RNA polymerase sigma-70 factor (ECF subfamily)